MGKAEPTCMRNMRVVIFSGGNIGRWAVEQVMSGDFLIGADRGALFLLENNLQPDMAIGDFDSLNEQEFLLVQQRCKEMVSCDPVDKDYTDTEMAFEQALKQRPTEIILLGVTGNRFDHTLANVHLLRKGMKKGVQVRIIDENNEITVINKTICISKGTYTHVSLLPLSLTVTGINLKGFRYPLNNATLEIGSSLAISNVLEQQEGIIEIKTGELLVIKSKD